MRFTRFLWSMLAGITLGIFISLMVMGVIRERERRYHTRKVIVEDRSQDKYSESGKAPVVSPSCAHSNNSDCKTRKPRPSKLIIPPVSTANNDFGDSPISSSPLTPKTTSKPIRFVRLDGNVPTEPLKVDKATQSDQEEEKVNILPIPSPSAVVIQSVSDHQVVLNQDEIQNSNGHSVVIDNAQSVVDQVIIPDDVNSPARNELNLELSESDESLFLGLEDSSSIEEPAVIHASSSSSADQIQVAEPVQQQQQAIASVIAEPDAQEAAIPLFQVLGVDNVVPVELPANNANNSESDGFEFVEDGDLDSGNITD